MTINVTTESSLSSNLHGPRVVIGEHVTGSSPQGHRMDGRRSDPEGGRRLALLPLLRPERPGTELPGGRRCRRRSRHRRRLKVRMDGHRGRRCSRRRRRVHPAAEEGGAAAGVQDASGLRQVADGKGRKMLRRGHDRRRDAGGTGMHRRGGQQRRRLRSQLSRTPRSVGLEEVKRMRRLSWWGRMMVMRRRRRGRRRGGRKRHRRLEERRHLLLSEQICSKVNLSRRKYLQQRERASSWLTDRFASDEPMNADSPPATRPFITN